MILKSFYDFITVLQLILINIVYSNKLSIPRIVDR